MQLPLVEELGFVRPSETSQANGALGVVWHELAPEEDHGRVEQVPVGPQLQPIERIKRVG